MLRVFKTGLQISLQKLWILVYINLIKEEILIEDLMIGMIFPFSIFSYYIEFLIKVQ